MPKPKALLFVAALFITISNVVSQEAIVRGFVYSAKTGEPVIYTNVYMEGTTYGATTDNNGFFTITDIPPGDYTLTVTFMGYDTLHKPISLKEGQVKTKKLYLTPGSVNIEGVNVSAKKTEARTETQTSMVKLTPLDIKRIPSVGGQPDIAQYMQVLPGVIFTGDQGGQLYIRGGSPIQNKVLLDGMTIYNPFHSIGLFSVFDTDIIRNVEVHTGGFGAEYGGRISSVMDITTRDGNKTRHTGNLSANTFGAKLNVEGPIKKLTDEGEGSSSFILSAKHSYLNETANTLYSYANEDGLPFSFTDLYGKVSLNTKNGSKINFFGFNYQDRVNNYRALSDFQWDALGAGSNFVIIPGASPILIEGYFAYSDYEARMDNISTEPRTSSINGFDLGLDVSYIQGDNKLQYGIRINGFTTDFYFTNAVGRKIQQKQNTTDLSGFAKGKFLLDNWILEPGLRLQYYGSHSALSAEPRIALKYNANEQLRFKMAGGLYSQNLISAKSSKDVVNLFYGILSGPENLPDTFRGERINHSLQKSEHLVVGVEYDFSDKLSTNIEGYFKNFSQLTNINRNKLYDENTNPDQPDRLVKDFIIEKGQAYGADITLEYKTGKANIYTVYTLGYVTRKDAFDTYSPHYDRRHNLNIVANYTFGKHDDWKANARWNLGSPFPFTQTQGAYGQINFEDGIDTDYTTVNEQFELLYAEYNEARLSYYHRLDLGLKKIFYLGPNSKLNINIGVTNAYNRENVFFVDRVTNERIDQLPIMPSFGFDLSF
ncbi:MAG: TonB-dependent receptor [Bacteroidales bacterium]|nr:TonB-dependent receptor [Bacteroidales bacterium]MCF8333869.1 TonB-dependent receptor [Bacteroidales bacterium]